MHTLNRSAAGGPGSPARRTDSIKTDSIKTESIKTVRVKTGSGTALGDKSHVWFTMNH